MIKAKMLDCLYWLLSPGIPGVPFSYKMNICIRHECPYNVETVFDDGARFLSCGPLQEVNITLEDIVETKRRRNGEDI